jgi:CRISPR-associated protein Cas1
MIAKIDLLDPRGDTVVPIEFKTGAPREGERVLWPPEEVQLCVQVLLLRDAGYKVDRAEVWLRRRAPATPCRSTAS